MRIHTRKKGFASDFLRFLGRFRRKKRVSYNQCGCRPSLGDLRNCAVSATIPGRCLQPKYTASSSTDSRNWHWLTRWIARQFSQDWSISPIFVRPRKLLRPRKKLTKIWALTNHNCLQFRSAGPDFNKYLPELKIYCLKESFMEPWGCSLYCLIPVSRNMGHVLLMSHLRLMISFFIQSRIYKKK